MDHDWAARRTFMIHWQANSNHCIVSHRLGVRPSFTQSTGLLRAYGPNRLRRLSAWRSPYRRGSGQQVPTRRRPVGGTPSHKNQFRNICRRELTSDYPNIRLHMNSCLYTTIRDGSSSSPFSDLLTGKRYLDNTTIGVYSSVEHPILAP